MKVKKIADGKLLIQTKINPSEHLLSTPDEIAAAGPDSDADDFALLLDLVITVVDTEVKTVTIDSDESEISISTKKKLRRTKSKTIRFDEIKTISLVEGKKRRAIVVEQLDGEKELITMHKSRRKIAKALKYIEEIFGSELMQRATS